jgi:hypothetical protein
MGDGADSCSGDSMGGRLGTDEVLALLKVGRARGPPVAIVIH